MSTDKANPVELAKEALSKYVKKDQFLYMPASGKKDPEGSCFKQIFMQSRRIKAVNELVEAELEEAVSTEISTSENKIFYTVISNGQMALKYALREYDGSIPGTGWWHDSRTISLDFAGVSENSLLMFLDRDIDPGAYERLDDKFTFPKGVSPGGALAIVCPSCSCGDGCYKHTVLFMRKNKDDDYVFFGGVNLKEDAFHEIAKGPIGPDKKKKVISFMLQYWNVEN